jgi:uncharacterized protein (DUF2235 family)
MAKRIVVCSDGTGNTAIKGRGTNVFKLFEGSISTVIGSTRTSCRRSRCTTTASGRRPSSRCAPRRGACGWGLSRNVKQLYKELVRLYDPGDEIYVFGFSRGAFTVRTLVGLIATCGMLDRSKFTRHTAAELESLVGRAYSAYRKRYRTPLMQLFWGAPCRKDAEDFKAVHSLPVDVRVRFVGVWDTVDAVGLPFHLADVLNASVYRFKFPDRTLSRIVDRACHALSIDDQRHSFHPLLWKETEEDRASGRIEQVWFAGAHSNVGGGYPKQGMSLVALDWMLAQAERAGQPFGTPGLRLNQQERCSYREHANADDKLYDPRAGLGIFYRWRIRDIERLCREHGVQPKVHLSVLERVAHGTDDYAPGNLPRDARVVITEPQELDHAVLAEWRAANVEEQVRASQDRLLDRVPTAVRAGLASYYVLLASCAAGLVVASGAEIAPQPRALVGVVNAISGLIGRLAASPVSTALDMSAQLVRHPWTIAMLAAAYLIDFGADRKMSRVFSQYWHERQPHLREALKAARANAARMRAAPTRAQPSGRSHASTLAR